MKKLIATTIGTVGLLLAVGTSYGQGTIDVSLYDNGHGLFDGPLNNVASPAGTQVQILAGATAGSMVAVFNVATTPINVFTVTAGDVAGSADGGSAFDATYGHVPSVAPGASAFVQVIAWHGAASYAAAQTTPGAWWGFSSVFTENLGTSPAPPTPAQAAPLMLPGAIHLQSPEPATFALGGLGAAALLLFRRKK